MKKIFITCCFYSILFADSSFITSYEYGKLLYKNPRDIGCNKCHGAKAEGMLIEKYTQNKKEIEIRAPKIQKIDKEQLAKGLNRHSMFVPRYRLTDNELNSLVEYLKKIQ